MRSVQPSDRPCCLQQRRDEALKFGPERITVLSCGLLAAWHRREIHLQSHRAIHPIHVTSMNFAPRQPTRSIVSFTVSETMRATRQFSTRNTFASSGIAAWSSRSLVTCLYSPTRSARWSCFVHLMNSDRDSSTHRTIRRALRTPNPVWPATRSATSSTSSLAARTTARPNVSVATGTPKLVRQNSSTRPTCVTSANRSFREHELPSSSIGSIPSAPRTSPRCHRPRTPMSSKSSK